MRALINCLFIIVSCFSSMVLKGQPASVTFTYDEASEMLFMDCKSRCAIDPSDAKNKIFFDFWEDELRNNYNGKIYDKEELGSGYKPIEGWFFFDQCNAQKSCESFSREDSLKFLSTDLRTAHYASDGFPKSVGGQGEVSVKVLIKHKPISITEKGCDTMPQETSGLSTAPIKISWLVYVGVILLLLIVIGSFVHLKRKPKEIKKKSSINQEDLGLVVVEEESQYEIGLAEVKRDIDHYYIVDLNPDFTDTTVKKIYLHYTVIKKMYDFFKHFLESPDQTNETGCYFVGCWEYANDDKTEYNISLEEIVEPSDDIVPGEFSFNFGKKIGVKLSTLLSGLQEKTGRDYVQTVWMHSHPGLGLFLSSHDLLVQQQLSYQDDKNRLVAIVIDTNTPNWEMAIFSAKHNGLMNNKDTLTKTYSLEEMYQWSRTIAKRNSIDSETYEPSNISSSINVENYHAVQIHHQSTCGISNLFFNGTSISALDDIFYKCNEVDGICGHFIGHEHNKKYFTIEDCVPDPVNQPIGVLIVNSKLSYSDVINQYGTNIPSNGFAMIYKSDDDIWICFKEANDTKCTDEKDLTCCSFKPMKEWMRRRRIYK